MNKIKENESQQEVRYVKIFVGVSKNKFNLWNFSREKKTTKYKNEVIFGC